MRVDGKKEQLEKNLAKESEVNKESSNTVREMEKKHTKCTEELTKMRDELLNAKSEFSAFERKDVKLKEEIKYQKNKQKKLEETIASDNKKVIEKKQFYFEI